MVNGTRGTTDTRRIRRLKRPRAVEVEAGPDGLPLRLKLSGGWQEVLLARRPWRIDQQWWRVDPVKRIYFRVTPLGGPSITIYWDELSGEWARQEY